MFSDPEIRDSAPYLFTGEDGKGMNRSIIVLFLPLYVCLFTTCSSEYDLPDSKSSNPVSALDDDQSRPVLPDSIFTNLYASETDSFRIEKVAEGLGIPFGFAFLPDGRALLTERPQGRMSLVDIQRKQVIPLEQTPDVFGKGGGGMLDVIVHPDFNNNGWIYFSYSVQRDTGNTTVVDRARLEGTRLADRKRLFTALPHYDEEDHFGGRLVLRDGYLFIAVGDRLWFNRNRAQDLTTHNGKIIRLFEDGRIPEDNPFVDEPGAKPEIWCYGHRNIQGLTLHPQTGELWEHEHGPRGGDEINLIEAGKNYGWPVITYGIEYSGEIVGDGLTRKKGMEQPVYYYNPSIAPSGMTFYNGEAFPDWRNSLFIGSLALTHINRVVIEGHRVLHEERLLDDLNWRIRFVRQGPDGLIYFGIDHGYLLRLRPV